MNDKRDAGSDIIRQGSILAIASIVVRIIGLFYRIPMANIIGEEAMGIYSAAFEIYNIILILSSFSLPLAVSKLITERMIRHQFRNGYRVFVRAFIFALVVGAVAGGFLFFSAQWLEQAFFDQYQGIAISLRILAPTIFLVAVLGVFRGFFQGINTMVPTAVSQVIEQIVNAAISIVAAAGLIRVYAESDYVNAWGAAGGTLGTCIGALLALLFCVFVYVLYFPKFRRQIKADITPTQEAGKDIYRMILVTVMPIILSQTVYQISGVIDITMLNDALRGSGTAAAEVSILQGNYSTLYRLLISVPIAISSSFAGAVIPNIVMAHNGNSRQMLHSRIKSTIQFNMNIAIPSTVALMVLGRPILQILFPSYDLALGEKLLLAGSTAIIFYAHSTITSSVLQSISKMKIPVIHSALALVVHIIVVWAGLEIFNLGVFALVAGNIIFPLIVMVLNSIALRRAVGYRDDGRRVFVLPLISAAVMGIVCLLLYRLLMVLTGRNMIAVMACIITGVVVYFALMLRSGGITGDELLEFPGGRTLHRIAVRSRLLR